MSASSTAPTPFVIVRRSKFNRTVLEPISKHRTEAEAVDEARRLHDVSLFCDPMTGDKAVYLGSFRYGLYFRADRKPAINPTTVHAELLRELQLRARVYPKWVAEGRMTEDDACHKIALLESAVLHYAELISEQTPNLFSDGG